MRSNIRLSLPTHGAIELLAGLAMMLAPAILAFGVAGLLISVTLGAILTGNALELATRRPGTVSAHGQFDTVFVLATALAALVLALAGHSAAVIFLVVIVVLEAALGLGTRYTAFD
jgi:hypothetical protein